MSIIRQHQQVPDDFAETLRNMYRGDQSERLDALLLLANLNGWTLTALALPLGITREWVRQRVARARPMVGLPEVPPPPRRPTPLPRADRRLRLKPDVIDELRQMQQVAATVNGATPADHPAREVSVAFTAQLAAYIEQGVSVKYLARQLGVRPAAINMRLARHGYRQQFPSQVGTPGEVYKGRKVGDVLRDKCRRGHPMSGDNLRIYPSGRSCRACEQIRYRARRAAVAS